MPKSFLPIIFSLVSFFGSAQERVLVFHETEGYRHASIETGIQTIQEIANQDNFQVEVSQDSRFFEENDLSQFDLIIFLNTTGDILNREEERAFEAYMDTGGNFFGIHAAADTEFDWNWYGDLVGAYFDGHPKIQKARIEVLQRDHYTLEHLDEEWFRKDEWYNYKEIRSGLNVLMKLDESSYKGGTNGGDHPIAWYQNYIGGGISIYTGGGHTVDSYSEPDFVEHIRRCISYALGRY